MKNKKILWIINQYSNIPEFAGHTRQYEIAKYLIQKGWEVELFASDYNLSERKCNIIVNNCIDLISDKLNNTRAICKKSYICNDILDDFKNHRENFINQLKSLAKSKLKNCNKYETILLKLLKIYKTD